MAITHPIDIKWEVHDFEMPKIYSDFLAIVGIENVDKCLDVIAQRTVDPMWAMHYLRKHYFETALLNIRSFVSENGRLPPITFPGAYPIYGFMLAVVDAHRQLTPAGRNSLEGRLHDGFKSEYGLAPLEFEFSFAAHFAKQRCRVEFADFDGTGRFEFLLERNGLEFELECKTIGLDARRRIKIEPALRLFERIRQTNPNGLGRRDRALLVNVSIQTALSSKAEELESITALVNRTLLIGANCNDASAPCRTDIYDFDVAESPINHGASQIDKGRLNLLTNRLFGRRNLLATAFCEGQGAPVLITLSSDKPDKDIDELFREPRDSVNRQFTKQRPAILCVHLLGLSPPKLLELANGPSEINIAVTRILSNPSRAHLHSVVIRGHFSPEFLNIRADDAFEVGPTYTTYSILNAHRDDPRCDIFNTTR